MSDNPILSGLPDYIEQFLLDGQPLCAEVALAHRRQITIREARFLVERWLLDRRRAGEGEP